MELRKGSTLWEGVNDAVCDYEIPPSAFPSADMQMKDEDIVVVSEVLLIFTRKKWALTVLSVSSQKAGTSSQ